MCGRKDTWQARHSKCGCVWLLGGRWVGIQAGRRSHGHGLRWLCSLFFGHRSVASYAFVMLRLIRAPQLICRPSHVAPLEPCKDVQRRAMSGVYRATGRCSTSSIAAKSKASWHACVKHIAGYIVLDQSAPVDLSAAGTVSELRSRYTYISRHSRCSKVHSIAHLLTPASCSNRCQHINACEAHFL